MSFQSIMMPLRVPVLLFCILCSTMFYAIPKHYDAHEGTSSIDFYTRFHNTPCYSKHSETIEGANYQASSYVDAALHRTAPRAGRGGRGWAGIPSGQTLEATWCIDFAEAPRKVSWTSRKQTLQIPPRSSTAPKLS